VAKSSTNRLYWIPVLSKALDVLEFLQAQPEPQSLESIYAQTRISKTTIYRILKTLVHRGYLGQGPDRRYRVISRPKKAKFGFGSESSDLPFSRDVEESLRKAAASAGIDLLVLDNRYDAATALQNAEEFVKQRVDLVIEFQIDQYAAPVIADKLQGAAIPMIAVDIPHPHATFFGVDNYRVGYEAGRCLAEHAKSAWAGKVSWVVGLGIDEAGPLVQSRTTGAYAAIREAMPWLTERHFVTRNGQGLRDESRKIMREFLRRQPKDRGILIAAATDTSALGALDALRELKRERFAAIVGQDCIDEALAEMRKSDSALIASVSHEANTYGPRLINLGVALLTGQTVKPYNYIEHKLITAKGLSRTARAAG
jgi:ribose transport system substrate-binding protein